jgi:V/A-type H+/Na+-transporting ATPase subunit I
MSLIKTKKIRVFIHESVKHTVFEVLQKIGIFEFVEVDRDDDRLFFSDDTTGLSYKADTLDLMIAFLEQYSSPKKGIQALIEGNRIFTSEQEIIRKIGEIDLDEIEKKIFKLQEDLSIIENELEHLQKDRTLLFGWQGLEARLDTPLETVLTRTIFISGESEDARDLEESLEKTNEPYHLSYLQAGSYSLTYIKKNEPEFLRATEEVGFKKVVFPRNLKDTPREEVAYIDREIKRKELLKQKLEKEAEILAMDINDLKMAADHFRWEKERTGAVLRSALTEKTVVIEGWCPVQMENFLKDKIEEVTSLYVIEDAELREGEEPPVEVMNDGLAKPFEMITRLYGLPGGKDLDPTPYLAGFFFLFFGFALSDTGYGVLLLAVSLGMMHFFKVPKASKPFLYLVAAGGIGSILFGLLFGGHLGIPLESLPGFLQAIQIFDPIASPLSILFLALSFGVLHIMFGMILSIVRDARNGLLLDGLLNQVPWLLFFVTLGLWVANGAGFVGPTNSNVFLWLLYMNIALIVATQGRKKENIFMKVIFGVSSLYAVVGFFSDILSYSRLLALGLATTALSFSVNLIALMLVDMIPYVGYLLAIPILIVGHVFNLAVNSLGAFIHGARLQFVEFFTRFIVGSGRQFHPFKRSERYVILE